MFFTLKRCFESVSDNLQSKSVKFSGKRTPEIRKVLTETTLKTFRINWGRKDRARGRGICIFDQNLKRAFQLVKQVEKRSCTFLSNSELATLKTFFKVLFPY